MMSASRESSKPLVLRGQCRTCGAKYVIVAYAHPIQAWEIRREVEAACPHRQPVGQAVLPLKIEPEESESSDEEIPF